MFMSCRVLTSVPLFDTSSVTNMTSMFQSCYALASVPLLDTSSVTDMSYMFDSCRVLASIPLFDTSSVTDMSCMFWNCYNVESGALALYQQASSQATVPTHNGAFAECGSGTVTGAAELAQIPSEWGGTGA
jgi:surface protein